MKVIMAVLRSKLKNVYQKNISAATVIKVLISKELLTSISIDFMQKGHTNVICVIRKQSSVDPFDTSTVETGNARHKKEIVCSSQTFTGNVYSLMVDGRE